MIDQCPFCNEKLTFHSDFTNVDDKHFSWWMKDRYNNDSWFMSVDLHYVDILLYHSPLRIVVCDRNSNYKPILEQMIPENCEGVFEYFVNFAKEIEKSSLFL